MFVKTPFSCLLILTSHILYTMCFDCTVKNKHGPIKECTKHCCGTLDAMYCKESCDGIKCEKDEGCAGLCCKDGTCQSCGLSKTVVILIAVGAILLVASLTIVVLCCCRKKPAAPRASGWRELHGAASEEQTWLQCVKEADVNWNKVNVYMDLQHLVIIQILIVK